MLIKMSVVKKEYINCFYDITEPEDLTGPGHWRTDPFILPDWFSKANLPIKKIIRVLGATGTTYLTDQPGQDEIPSGMRLMGNLTKDFPSNEYIMMLNNYNCIKEFDITYHGITALDWFVLTARGLSYPNLHDVHLNLVVELELLLIVDEN
jgi:hypothetical protein